MEGFMSPTNLSRRTLVTTGAATLPALAVPALASARPDPIFAAIEAHRHAVAETKAAFGRQFAIEDELHTQDDPRCIAAERDTIRAHRVQDALAFDLTTVATATFAGAVALLNYYVEIAPVNDFTEFPEPLEDIDNPIANKAERAPYGYLLARNVAHTLTKIAREAVQS
jgi:hypothetical protein